MTALLSPLRYIFAISTCFLWLISAAQIDVKQQAANQLEIAVGADLYGVTSLPLQALLDPDYSVKQRLYGNISLVYANLAFVEFGLGQEKRQADRIYSSLEDFNHQSTFSRFTVGFQHRVPSARLGVRFGIGWQTNEIVESGNIVWAAHIFLKAATHTDLRIHATMPSSQLVFRTK